MRVNLLCLALTALLERPLPDVLAERVMEPLGASATWSWHGYTNSTLSLADHDLPVASGGAHWGGGLWINAIGLALIGWLNDQQTVFPKAPPPGAAPAATSAATCSGSTPPATW